MQKIIVPILLAVSAGLQAQSQPKPDCVLIDYSQNHILLRGDDFKQPELNKAVFEVPASFFSDNFCLALADSSSRLLGFTIVFDNGDGNLYTFSNDQLCVDVNQNEIRRKLKKISDNGLVTLENIRVVKNGICYKLPACLLFVKNKPE